MTEKKLLIKSPIAFDKEGVALEIDKINAQIGLAEAEIGLLIAKIEYQHATIAGLKIRKEFLELQISIQRKKN